VSDPAHPTEVGFYDTPGDACGVAMARNYACVADYDAGLRIIEYVSVDVEETPNAGAQTLNVGPTIVRGVLNLQSAICNLQSETALLDISGRKALDLHPGANDVGLIPPGVYFVLAVGREPSAVSCRKVVITR
jgi:hypothetical protein